MSEVKLNWLQRVILRIRGNVYVGHRIKPGWRSPLPFYAFRCERHGIVKSYPEGYYLLLVCLHCIKEEQEKRP